MAIGDTPGSIPFIGAAQAGSVGVNVPLIGQALTGVNPPPADTAPAGSTTAAPNSPKQGLDDVPDNLPLSKELISNPSNWGVTPKLLHGYMKNTPTAAAGIKDFYVYFLFNPLEIENRYSFDSNVLPQAQQKDQNVQSEAAIMQNQAFSFQIEFDRTYEVESFYAGHDALSGTLVKSSPGKDGVAYDVRAVERLLGMYDTAIPGQQGSQASGNAGGSGNAPQNSPIDVFFSSTPAFAFRGWMTSFEVQLSRFSHSMVPVHCTMNITMARTFLDPKELDINTGPPGATLQTVTGAVLPPDPSLYPHLSTSSPAAALANVSAATGGLIP